jgi:hypothetical protein
MQDEFALVIGSCLRAKRVTSIPTRQILEHSMQVMHLSLETIQMSSPTNRSLEPFVYTFAVSIKFPPFDRQATRGRIWSSPKADPGATIRFTLTVEGSPQQAA